MIQKFSITEKKSGMIFLKRELPGQPPKRQTGIEKIGKNRTKLSGKRTEKGTTF